MTGIRTLADLHDEMDFLKAKMSCIERKRAALLDAEASIRIDMQRVEIQIHRLQQLADTPQ